MRDVFRHILSFFIPWMTEMSARKLMVRVAFSSFISLKYPCIRTDTVLYMLIRFSFSKSFDWHMITVYKYSLRKFSFSRHLGKYTFYSKTRFFSKTKKLAVGKILYLYTINEALSNVRLKFPPYSLLFFSIFFFQPYNTSAIHPYMNREIHKIVR